MTEAQAFMVWKCTGRCAPNDYARFQAMRAAELVIERALVKERLRGNP